MYGEGNSQLVEAMGQVLLQENARKNLLQASEGEGNIIITFDSEIKNIYTSESAEATDLEQLYQQKNLDVPVFSIMFGNVQSAQLEDLAELTNARVFDGRKDLVAAFRSVKGYN